MEADEAALLAMCELELLDVPVDPTPPRASKPPRWHRLGVYCLAGLTLSGPYVSGMHEVMRYKIPTPLTR